MKEEKAKKLALVRAEVIDNMVALNVGDNVYKPFFKGAIVEIDPITFRNLERDGRVKGAPSSTAVSAVGTTGILPVEKKKKRSKTTGKMPTGPTGKMPVLQQQQEKEKGVTLEDHAA